MFTFLTFDKKFRPAVPYSILFLKTFSYTFCMTNYYKSFYSAKVCEYFLFIFCS